MISADVCRSPAIAPGVRVDIEVSPDSQFAMVLPAHDIAQQPMEKLIGMLKHKGKPVPVKAMNGGENAAR